MFHRRREFLRLRLALADMIITAASFGMAYVLRQHLPSMREFYLLGPTLIGLLLSAIVIWPVAGWTVGVSRKAGGNDTTQLVAAIIKQAVWSTAALVSLLYLAKLGDISRSFVLLFIGINTVLLLAWRLSPLMGVAAGAKRHFVIVGIGEDAWNVAQLIESIGNRSSEIVAFFRDQPEHTAGRSAVEAACPGARVLELSMFQQMLKDHIVDEVIFAVDRQSMQTLEDLFLLCEEEGVKFRVMVNFFPAMASEVTLDRLYDLPLLTFSTTPDNDYLLFLKRIIDVIGAIGILLFFSPLLLPIVLAIKLTSKGPLLFMQQRCGLNGRLFRLYKFRSMYEDAAARRAEMEGLNEMDGPVFKCANDPRITTVGRFLRKYSLDEIPQLLNVVNGDMSLVGPRPPLPEEVKQYEQWHRRRLRMRPGLTCLWVLEGRNKLDFFSWMRLDLEYIDHWSLVLDCKILLLSIPHVLSGKGM